MAQRSSPGPQHTNTAASENADPITHQVGGSQGCEVMDRTSGEVWISDK